MMSTYDVPPTNSKPTIPPLPVGMPRMNMATTVSTTFRLVTFLFLGGIYARNITPPLPVATTITVSPAIEFKVTKSVNLLFRKEPVKNREVEIAREKEERSRRKAQVFKYSIADGSQFGNDSTTIQTTMGKKPSPGFKVKWNGLMSNAVPLDPTGSVGLTQYVQSINATPYGVYDKTGTETPVYEGSVGTITGGTGDLGDPILAYDKFADRWCATQMFGSSGVGFAVSKTNDPAGEWYAYKFNSSGSDYLKFSIWSDGYYMTFNNGGTLLILEREAMLAGKANARSIKATFTKPTNAGGGFWLPLPGDADGIIPPAGLRCPLFSFTDNAWGAPEIDGVKIWSVGVTWGTTPTANVTLDATIPTAAFDASYSLNFEDITQPGSQKMDAIAGICMYRAQWSNFIGTNRVALNWTVKIGSGRYSIKWVELRQDQKTKAWSLFQEGTYAPDPATRWIGSIAMDVNGSIALCYAKTSSSIPMSLAYTGRIQSDPLGIMSLAETIVFPGTGSIPGARIGDYSHTSLDPSDGTTFWHTGTFSNNGRKTGIYSFQIPIIITNNKTGHKIAINPEFSAYLSGRSLLIEAAKLPRSGDYTVQLFEVSGKFISKKLVMALTNSFKTTISLEGMATGTYLVRIGTPEFQRMKKVTIQ